MMLRNFSGLKLALALCCVLALTACSKKNTPNLEAANAGLGVGSSAPGSEQDFATNVGDRVYFVVDQADLTPEAEEILSKRSRLVATSTPAFRSRWKAIRMNAAHVNTISPFQPAVPRPPASFSLRKALKPTAFPPLPMARNGQRHFVTQSNVGHKIAVL